MTAEDRLLSPAEAAALLQVNPTTVRRWARTGQLKSLRTLGGHHRFRESDVLARLRRRS